jgi:hypothetical protein
METGDQYHRCQGMERARWLHGRTGFVWLTAEIHWFRRGRKIRDLPAPRSETTTVLMAWASIYLQQRTHLGLSKRQLHKGLAGSIKLASHTHSCEHTCSKMEYMRPGGLALLVFTFSITFSLVHSTGWVQAGQGSPKGATQSRRPHFNPFPWPSRTGGQSQTPSRLCPSGNPRGTSSMYPAVGFLCRIDQADRPGR